MQLHALGSLIDADIESGLTQPIVTDRVTDVEMSEQQNYQPQTEQPSKYKY